MRIDWKDEMVSRRRTMAAGDSTPVGTADEGVVIERVFDAPRELVWRGWAGAGEIVPLERFVATESPSDADGNAVPPSQYGMPEGMSMETIVTVTLEDLDGGRTKMTLNQTGFPSEDWAAGARGGWNQAFDKLVAVFVDA